MSAIKHSHALLSQCLWVADWYAQQSQCVFSISLFLLLYAIGYLLTLTHAQSHTQTHSRSPANGLDALYATEQLYLARFLGTKFYFVQPIRNEEKNVIIYLPQKGQLWQIAINSCAFFFEKYGIRIVFFAIFARYQHSQFECR